MFVITENIMKRPVCWAHTLIVILYLLTYSMQQDPSWEANWFAASQEIPSFCGTRMFITAFTSAHHVSLSWASSIHSTFHIPLPKDPSSYYFPIYAWVSPAISFPQVSPPKSCTRLSPPHTFFMSNPSHSSWFYHPHTIGWPVQILTLLIM